MSNVEGIVQELKEKGSIEVIFPCSQCKGSGKDDPGLQGDCELCQGSGSHFVAVNDYELKEAVANYYGKTKGAKKNVKQSV